MARRVPPVRQVVGSLPNAPGARKRAAALPLLPKHVTRPPGIARGFSFAWDPSCVPASTRQLARSSSPGSACLVQLAWFSSRARAAPGLSQSPAGVRGESGRSPSLTAWQSCGKLRVTLGSSLCCVSSTRTLRSCSFSTGRLSGGFLFSDSELSSTTLLEGLAVNVGPTKLINVLPSCVTARLPKKLSLTAWPDQAVKLEWSPAVRTAWVRGESGVSRDRHSLACPGPGPARWPGRASALPGPRASSKRPRAGTQRP